MDSKRAPNFTSQEEKILVALSKKYSHIIENKMSNVNINNQKMLTWTKIEEEFNSSVGTRFRDVKVLRKKYENIKKRTKRKFADEKSHVLGTSGGSQMDNQIDDLDMDVKEILGIRLEGRATEFGGDVEDQPDEVYNDCVDDEALSKSQVEMLQYGEYDLEWNMVLHVCRPETIHSQ
uniref:Regulatory protein zeste n=1 Tax=Diabrotica virgifera virgifera TaxID=50390 RepID=A0A6P7G1M5_DIAVI